MSTSKRLALDVALFVAMLIANNPAVTGLAVHEWLSVAIVVPLLAHLVINWEWTARVANDFFARLFHASRLNFVVDGLLFVSAVAVMLSGLMVSQVVLAFLGISAAPGAVWVALHSASAGAVVALLLAHSALHWRWFARAIRRAFVPAPRMAPVRIRQMEES